MEVSCDGLVVVVCGGDVLLRVVVGGCGGLPVCGGEVLLRGVVEADCGAVISRCSRQSGQWG